MARNRVYLPVWVLALLGVLLLGLFTGIRVFGPDYVAVPINRESEDWVNLKETLRTRGVPFIATESELWIPREEYKRLCEDLSLAV